MKTYKSLIALSMALVMLLAAVACAGPTVDETTTAITVNDTVPPQDSETESIYDEKGYLKDSLPELNYNGDTIKVLHWSDVERAEFEVKEEELDGSIVKDAIYNRNERTMERLGIKFEWIGTPGNTNNRDNFEKYVTNAQASGDKFDIIATYSKTSGLLITRGLVGDFNKVENSYLNPEMPWWPASMLSTCTIGNGLYSISGDISTNLLHFMYAIYYNQDLLKDLNLDDPVQYVDNMTWTLDKLIDMTKDVYVDSDNDGKISEGDRFGFGSEFYHTDALYFGSGLRLLENDPDELVVLSEDYTSQKAIDLFDRLRDWFKTNDAIVKVSGNSVEYVKPFVNGTMLFQLNRVYIADQQSSTKLHDVSWTYGIIPVPLHDENQERYYTVVGNPITLWSIGYGLTPDEASRSTAVIECLASYAYRLTTPAIFDTNMKYRYTTDNKGDSVRMFDIVHDTITFDLGRFFADATGTMSEIPTTLAAQGESWGARYKPYLTKIKNGIKNEIVKGIRDNYGA